MTAAAEREPLVLLPGMGCSPRLWAGVRAVLAPRETRVEELDEPDLDACVAELLDRLPDRFALAGLSLGGIVAMALVRTAPERVTRLCLMATNARPPTDAQRTAWDQQIATLAADGSATELQSGLLEVLLGPAADEDTAAETLLMAEEVGAERYARQLRLQGTRRDERLGLGDVRVPTLVVAGSDDALCGLDRHQEIHDLVPGSRLEVLADTGHLSPLERPEQIATILEEWLDS